MFCRLSSIRKGKINDLHEICLSFKTDRQFPFIDYREIINELYPYIAFKISLKVYYHDKT